MEIPRSDLHIKNAITACPRSGTRYLSVAFNNLGIQLGHEIPAKDGIVSWHLAGYLGYGAKYDNLIHVVRDPIDTISSIYHTLHHMGMVYAKAMLQMRTDDDLFFSLGMWVQWNKRIQEQGPNLRVKIEDLWNHDMDKWNELIQSMYSEYQIEDMQSIEPGKVNHVKDYENIRLYELKKYPELYKDMVSLAQEYGYYYE